MARAAVKAKQAAKAAGKPAQKTHAHGRRRHASGGNPNQDLFFMRMRRHAKWVYVLLAVLFAITFAFLGVGSGTSGGLDQLFQGLNIFHRSSNAVSKAQGHIKDHPKDPKGYRDLATAYESKGETASAIGALEQYTNLKPKDAKAWSELGGLQTNQAQTYLAAYQAAYTERQLAAPSESFLPKGKLGTALGTNEVEKTESARIDSSVQNLQQQTQLAYTNALTSYQKVTKLTPTNSDAWFQYAQAGQQSGNYAAALTGYKRYLKLNPESTSRTQIEQLIAQLSPAVPAPQKKKK